MSLQEGNSCAAIPKLLTLSRHALLHGLAEGVMISLPESFCFDDDLWDDLLHEGSRRKLLCDKFINALVASGVPLRTLVLKQSDIGVSSCWLKNSVSTSSSSIVAPSSLSFTDSGDQLLQQLSSFSFIVSGSAQEAATRSTFGKCGISPTYEMHASTPLSSIDASIASSHCMRTGNKEELVMFLHRLARNGSNLNQLHLDLRDLCSQKIQLAGSLKAITVQCKHLQELSLHGIKHMEIFESSDGTFVEALASACGQLRKLSLSNCTGFRDRHGQSLLRLMGPTATRSLRISKDRNGLSQEQTYASPWLKNLQELDLSFTAIGSLTFAALHSRAQERRQWMKLMTDSYDENVAPIASINLNGTTIEFTWLRKIIEAWGEDLEELSLLSCPRLNDGTELWTLLTKSSFNSTGKASDEKKLAALSSNVCNLRLAKLKSLSIELWFDSPRLIPTIQNHPLNYSTTEEHLRTPIDDVSHSMEPPGHLELGGGHGWVCRYCTLINEDDSVRCAACYGKRRIKTLNKMASQESRSSVSTSEQDSDSDTMYREEMIQAPFHFHILSFPQLEKLTVIAHVDDNDERLALEEDLEAKRHSSESNAFGSNATAILQNDRGANGKSDDEAMVCCLSAEAAISAFVHELVRCLPGSLTDLCISSMSSKCNFGKKSFTLGAVEVSAIIEKLGTVLRRLELSSVLFTNVESVKSLLNGMKELREIKVAGDGVMQPAIPDILNGMSTSYDADYNRSRLSCERLERLTLCVRHDGQNASSGGKAFVSGSKSSDLECQANESVLKAPSLERLWIQGCSSIQRLMLDTPALEWMHLSDCSSLSHISFCESLSTVNSLQHLQIRGNTSLDPYSIATLKLPNLKRLDLDGLHSLQDWQLKSMIHSARFSLTGVRLHCRSLGNVSSWMAGCGPFQPLSVLQLYRPSTSFDISNMQSLFLDMESVPSDSVSHCKVLRDLIVHRAAGMKGILCASVSSGAGVDRQKSYTFTRHASSSRLGTGAIDDENEELMGTRHIERILHESIEAAWRGGPVRYQFPPTLNSYQRRLVHEVAENMGLEHESISLGRGVKVVEVRIRIDAVPQVEEEGVETFYDARQRNVMFHLADSSSSDGDGDDTDDLEPAGSQFELEIDESLPTATQAVGEIDDVTHEPATLSRRAARHASKRKGKGSAFVPQDVSTASSFDNEEVNGDGDGGAMDPTLQCEITGYIDSKLLRRLVASARQLPIDNRTGRAVCIKYLRGVCPYQDSMNGGNCNYAHFELKPNKLKKFSQLMDFVCGREGDAAAGGRQGGIGTRKKNAERQLLPSSHGSNDGSYGRVEGAELMELNFGGSWGRRRSRSGSLGSETDDADEESYSLEGTSPAGRSPGFASSPNLMSSSPAMADILRDPAPRLDLACLLRLELTNCEGLTGASLSGRSLLNLSLQGCTNLSFLDVWAPELDSLDVSDCMNLRAVPLYRDSLRRLQVAVFTNCRELNEAFMGKFVDHCRSLCQLHIFGSGASEKASNAKSRQKVKTKAGLAKLAAGRPKLELFTTKKDWRVLKAKGGGIARFDDYVNY